MRSVTKESVREASRASGWFGAVGGSEASCTQGAGTVGPAWRALDAR